MKTSLAPICIAIAAIACFPAHAQGELGNLPKPPAYSKRTPDQRAAGKAQRRVEGREAARVGSAGEVGPQPKAQAAVRYGKDEKAAARATRKAVTARANKAGEITTPGELGPKN